MSDFSSLTFLPSSQFMKNNKKTLKERFTKVIHSEGFKKFKKIFDWIVYLYALILTIVLIVGLAMPKKSNDQSNNNRKSSDIQEVLNQNNPDGFDLGQFKTYQLDQTQRIYTHDMQRTLCSGIIGSDYFEVHDVSFLPWYATGIDLQDTYFINFDGSYTKATKLYCKVDQRYYDSNHNTYTYTLNEVRLYWSDGYNTNDYIVLLKNLSDLDLQGNPVGDVLSMQNIYGVPETIFVSTGNVRDNDLGFAVFDKLAVKGNLFANYPSNYFLYHRCGFNGFEFYETLLPNAPLGINSTSVKVTDERFGSTPKTYIVTYYTGWFYSNGHLYDEIKFVYPCGDYSNSGLRVSTGILGDGTTPISLRANEGVFAGMVYYNSENQDRAEVYVRNYYYVEWTEDLTYLVYYNDFMWTLDSYRYIDFVGELSLENLNNLARVNAGESTYLPNSNTGSADVGDGTFNNVIDIIKVGFGGLLSILNINIFPSMTLGLLLFVPLLITIIVLVVRLVKK